MRHCRPPSPRTPRPARPPARSCPERADVALIVLAADKGAPGVTTAATALGAVWPRPVLLAECDPSGGDLADRLPGADGRLSPSRGLLSLGAVARRGLHPDQIYEHTQRLVGGLDVLAGLTNGEQASGLTWMW